MRAQRRESESGIYHAVTKGVGGQIIFEDDEDRSAFLALLQRGLKKHGGLLLAWCLMDNHVHLLLQIHLEGLAKLLRKILSAYALQFNRRHGRTGHLFQGRFFSEPVEDDAYLMMVVRYIHRNPVRACIVPVCGEYPWSSYGEYCGKPALTSTGLVMSLFDSKEQFAQFHAQEDDAGLGYRYLEGRKRLTDAESLNLALEIFGDEGLGGIKALPREERNESIRRLKSEGCTTRQIQRLTGVSLGSISKA